MPSIIYLIQYPESFAFLYQGSIPSLDSARAGLVSAHETSSPIRRRELIRSSHTVIATWCQRCVRPLLTVVGRAPDPATRSHGSNAGTRIKNVQTPSSIGMRMICFRQQQVMLSWIGGDVSQTIRNVLWERLRRGNQVANSIRGLGGRISQSRCQKGLDQPERAKRQEIGTSGSRRSPKKG